MKKIITASDEAKEAMRQRVREKIEQDKLKPKQEYNIPPEDWEWLYDVPENDEIGDWFADGVSAATKDIEPFKEGDVVHVNATDIPEADKHFHIVITDAILISDDEYKYDGFTISSMKGEHDLERDSDTLIVKDFGSYLTDRHMKDSKDVHIYYDRPVQFTSSSFSTRGVFKGHLDSELVDYLWKIYVGEISDPPKIYGDSE
jgi:hypothetical protein